MEVKLYQYPRGANKGGILQGDICPTISTSSWENNCFLIECNIMKIRKPKCLMEKKGVRGGHTTTVQDILPFLPDEDCFFDCRHFVYDTTDGVLPFAITTRINANNQQYLKMVQKDNLLCIPQATKQGYAEVEVGGVFDAAYPESKTRRGRVQENGTISPTLCTSNELCVFEGESRRDDEDWKTVVGNKQMNPFRGSIDNEAPCITSACGAGGGMTPMITDADLEITKTLNFIEQLRGHQEPKYRIRKLTPRECFRLMGVSEEDIDTIQAAGISNSQQYKLAGNSIVVDVLYHIFRKLFIDKESEELQMTLF